MKLEVAAILVAMTALGQRGPEIQIVDRLNADLSGLQSLPGQTLQDPSQLTTSERAALKLSVKSESPRQNAAMSNIADEFNNRYGERLLSWDSAYVLTGALAGKFLEPESLNAFTRSFVKSMDSAYACSRMRMPVRSCKQFQDSIEQMYMNLFPLDVRSQDAQVLVESLIRMTDRLTSEMAPLVQPIPPARPMRPIRP